jgi:membrane protein YdbS with pleckstrin-like domain
MSTESIHHTTAAADGVSPLPTSSIIASPTIEPLYPQGIPDPQGTNAVKEGTSNTPGTVQTLGIGVEGEVVEWEARYSLKNFIARTIGLVVLTAMWLALAYEVWVGTHGNLEIMAYLTGGLLGVLWLAFLYRLMMARLGHFYQLTNRRLFVSTGVFRRRRDQMELLRVQDVYVKEDLFGRLMRVGTVAVISSEPALPVLYLTGVDDPKSVMDLVWHHARAERDRRSVKVDQI